MTKHSKIGKRTYITILLLLAAILSVSILFKQRALRLVIPERFRTGIWEFEMANIDKDPDIYTDMTTPQLSIATAGLRTRKTSIKKKGFFIDGCYHFFNGKKFKMNDAYRFPATKTLAISPSGKYIAIFRINKTSDSSQRVLYIGSNSSFLNSIENKKIEIGEYEVKDDSFTFNPNEDKYENNWLCVYEQDLYMAQIRNFKAVGHERVHTECVVVNGIEQEAYPKIHEARFSPNGEQVGYFAEVSGKGIVFVVDGKETGKYHQYVRYLDATSNEEGETLWTYVAGQKGNMQLYCNGLVGKSYDAIFKPAVSRDCKRIAFAAHNGSNLEVVLKDLSGAHSNKTFAVQHSLKTRVYISPDGSMVAYLVPTMDDNDNIIDMTLYINGELITTKALISDFVFSQDSKHYAYTATNSSDDDDALWSVYLDNKPSNREFKSISSLTFGSNNNQIAYIGIDDLLKYLCKFNSTSEALAYVFGDEAHIYADKYCFRAIALDTTMSTINMMEWYYRDK